MREIDELRPVDVDGYRAVALSDDVRAMQHADMRPQARLLPAFDPYVVAFAPHGHGAAVPSNRHHDIYRAQGWMSPVAVRQGRMVATWRHRRRARRLEFVMTPLEQVSDAVRRQCEEEAERVAARLAMAAQVHWADGQPH